MLYLLFDVKIKQLGYDIIIIICLPKLSNSMNKKKLKTENEELIYVHVYTILNKILHNLYGMFLFEIKKYYII